MYHTRGGEERIDARAGGGALPERPERSYWARESAAMHDEDLYRILGVAKGATGAEIKKAYRKLARELHPDRSKGNKNDEERFKKVSAAYAVLGNAEKRKLYDAYGIDGLRDGFDPKAWERARGFGGGGARPGAGGADFGGFAGFGGMEEIFEALFGGGGPRRGGPRRREWDVRVGSRGPDVRAQMEVGLLDAVLGRELQIVVPIEGERRSLKVKLPRGIEGGKSIRLKGQGARGSGDGGDGDLIVEIAVREDERYARRGPDLVKREDVTVGKAYFGGPLEVETPWGKGQVVVPPGTRGGTRIRIKGHGVRAGDRAGDLYVEINIVLPERKGEAVEAAVREMERLYGKG